MEGSSSAEGRNQARWEAPEIHNYRPWLWWEDASPASSTGGEQKSLPSESGGGLMISETKGCQVTGSFQEVHSGY